MESRLRDALTKWGFTAEEGEQALVTFVCARAVFSCACAVGTETKHRPSAAASTITLDVYGTAKARLYSMFQEIGLSKGDSQSMAVAMLTEGLAPPGTDAKSPAAAAENTPLDELFPDDFVHHGQQAELVKTPTNPFVVSFFSEIVSFSSLRINFAGLSASCSDPLAQEGQEDCREDQRIRQAIGDPPETAALTQHR